MSEIGSKVNSKGQCEENKCHWPFKACWAFFSYFHCDRRSCSFTIRAVGSTMSTPYLWTRARTGAVRNRQNQSTSMSGLTVPGRTVQFSVEEVRVQHYSHRHANIFIPFQVLSQLQYARFLWYFFLFFLLMQFSIPYLNLCRSGPQQSFWAEIDQLNNWLKIASLWKVGLCDYYCFLLHYVYNLYRKGFFLHIC